MAILRKFYFSNPINKIKVNPVGTLYLFKLFAVLLQIDFINFHSNASCFAMLWLYLVNIQLSVYMNIDSLVSCFTAGFFL